MTVSRREGEFPFVVKNLSKSSLEDGADIAWAEANHAGSALIPIIKDRAGL